MVNYGMAISENGVDVKTAAGTQLQFSSKYSTLKILGQGSVSMTTNGSGNGTATVAHNLGYAPAHYIWMKGTATNSFMDATTYSPAYVPITQSGGVWMGGQNQIYSYTNAGSLIIIGTAASANTTYNFKYYYLVDLGSAYSGTAGITLVDNYGLKVSKDTFDVKTAAEYNMVYSQKYKSLQYYDVLYGTSSISLPLMFADPLQTNVQAGGYIDIIHNLGYPPFFLAWGFGYQLFPGITNMNVFSPQQSGKGNLAANQKGFSSMDGFCDGTRVRLSLYEQSIAEGFNSTPNNGPTFGSTTVTFKWIIFTENLTI